MRVSFGVEKWLTIEKQVRIFVLYFSSVRGVLKVR